MGIVAGTAQLLLEESQVRPFGGDLLSLGRMDVYLSENELAALASKTGTHLQPDIDVAPSHNPALAAHGCMDDQSFFRLLGFDTASSLDVSTYEGADIAHDLNLAVPDELHGRFDVVFEGGTIQHVFHLPRVLANIHALLKPGGRIIHGIAPAANYVDHGFHTFSPTLFQDFYSVNGWQIESFLLCDFVAYWLGGRIHTDRFRVYPYEPGALDPISYGRWGHRQTAIFFVATRTPEATGDRIPQQGYYRQQWDAASHTAKKTPRGPKPWDALLAPLKLAREHMRRRWPSLPTRRRL
ncbi:MAG: class I SAM-dependent methyltransferase [Acidobacteriota bacterium]